MKDEIYNQAQPHLVDFAFDSRVAAVFPDMIRRSVPGYELVVPLSALMAARHLNGGERVYDLGCSLGATTLSLLTHLGSRSCDIVSVDNAPAMLERARQLVTDPRVRFVEADIATLPLDPARVVLCNWLLQFLPPQTRDEVIARIARALRGGGMLLMAEKIRDEDADTQDFFDASHLAFKAANGYTDLEISQKRAAIENVMIVDTERIHRQRLHAAGFSTVRVWYRCLNWIAIAAWA
ncbi:MAG: carboxy-S-adenosyl-L-methionine synthase CmoA [Pseudomonadales bacterium]|nr:carboxy-S-adenosyl-L-methionine synthase CmoA [Pseudomonadales bacterium]MCP5185679.1 carboxy-S-adenosyl-L-methionine synthase CmoA [Pseudomonadales bacterium]